MPLPPPLWLVPAVVELTVPDVSTPATMLRVSVLSMFWRAEIAGWSVKALGKRHMKRPGQSSGTRSIIDS